MNVYNTSEARNNLYKLVDYVADAHRPIYIKGKRNTAVMISEEDYRDIEETLHLSSIPGFCESIKEARAQPRGTYKKKLDW